MKVKKETEVAQSSPTLGDPMDCSLPGSTARGNFQARALEWVPLPSLLMVLRGGQSFSVQTLELLFSLIILGNKSFPITPLKGKKKQGMLL